MKIGMKKAGELGVKVCLASYKFFDFDTKTNEFTGLMAKPMGLVMRMIRDSFKNLTIIKSSDIQSTQVDVTANNLPGCWGALQRGEADLYFYPYEMPVMGLENITQVNSSTTQSGTYMLAPYSTDEARSEVMLSPLESLKTVSVDTWADVTVMMIIFAVIMYYLKLFVYKRPRSDYASGQKRQDARSVDEALHGQSLLYQVITHMMQVESCDYTGNTVRYMSLLMSVFAFLFIALLSCMITCDKVSTSDIQVYDTYDKILANKSVQPVWIENLDDYAAYKRAPGGSLQAQLWQQSIAISKKDANRPTLTATGLDSMLARLQDVRNKKIVMFVSNIFTKILIQIACTNFFTETEAFDPYRDLRVKGRLDDQKSASLYVMPLSVHSTVARELDYALRRVTESHLTHRPDVLHMIGTHVAKDYFRAKINYSEGYYQCLNFETLPPGESETSPLALVNTSDVFRWWAFGCFGSLIVLLLEHSHAKMCRGSRFTSKKNLRVISA